MKPKELNLLPTQKALLIWDVFKGQKTEKVLSKLTSKNIEVINVPANMTHFFQPLDLTVDRDAKKFMKDQFTSWYSVNVQSQLIQKYLSKTLMLTCDCLLSNQSMQLGSSACTIICLALKENFQLQKDGRRRG